MRHLSFKHRNRIRIFSAAILWIATALPQNVTAITSSEKLIVFVQSKASPIEKTFRQHHLPRIRELARTMDIPVHVVDAGDGAPAEIAITPLIVFQNFRGRSIYQGRKTTLDRIRNFIRTARWVSQGNALYPRRQIPIWQQGRTRTWAPLKVAAVTGTRPANYRHDTFVAAALKHIAMGFTRFSMHQTAYLERADRGFYMDFNPWLAKDGTLYLTMILFSQFDCKTPVFIRKIMGPWPERHRLFQQAAVMMEDAVVRITRDPASGDSYEPVPGSVPRLSWEKLGLALPPAPKDQRAQIRTSLKIPEKWIFARPGPEAPPMILFRFPPPLDHYAGEVTSVGGRFYLTRHLSVDGAKGWVEIDTTKAITMGDPDLDEAIRGSMLLNTKQFPSAGFMIEKIVSDGQPLAYGRLTPASITGSFTLKGISSPLTAAIEFDPVIGDDGHPLLLIRGTFKIDLHTFNIAGADGPPPANHTVLLDLNLILKED